MAFLTLLLGLITGVHPVQMTVPDPVIARIELRLDGRQIGVLSAEPWILEIDFGDDLSPHELLAVGFDSEGRQVAESRRWINMPDPRAEPEDSGSGDPRELTALVLSDDGGRLPEPPEVEGWIETGGEPVRVVSLERPGADVIMVQDLSWYLQKRLKGLRNEVLDPRISARRRPTGLKSRDQFHLLFPIPEASPEADARAPRFAMSPNLWTGQLIETFAQGAVGRRASEARPQGLMMGIPVNGERKLDTSNQHLTDAVAMGAMAAAKGHRARVLLLIAGSKEKDHSRFSPDAVRSYLARLNVPLRVWSPEPELVDAGWGEVGSIATRRRLELAMRELRSLLDNQLVVWVEGHHLPHRLELTAKASGWRLVAGTGPAT